MQNNQNQYIMSLKTQKEKFEISLCKNELCTGRLLSEVKPILRPLSDLFVLLNENNSYETLYDEMCSITSSDPEEEFMKNLYDFQDKLEEVDLEYAPWSIMCFLFENHFDVFGLIKKGLAIDINTLER